VSARCFSARPVLIEVKPGAAVPIGLLSVAFALSSGSGTSSSLVASAAVVGGVGGALSLLLHELGHVVAARRLDGVRPVRVSLLWIGAGTTFEGAYRGGRDQALVAAGGPAASLAFGLSLLLASLLPLPRPLQLGLFGLALLNGAIALVSLLPMHPLDGHKVLVGALWRACGSEQRARSSLRRLARAGLPVEAVASALLFAEKPFLGVVVVGCAVPVLAQRALVSRA
jgi:Zn-dependent protease